MNGSIAAPKKVLKLLKTIACSTVFLKECLKAFFVISLRDYQEFSRIYPRIPPGTKDPVIPLGTPIRFSIVISHGFLPVSPIGFPSGIPL